MTALITAISTEAEILTDLYIILFLDLRTTIARAYYIVVKYVI